MPKPPKTMQPEAIDLTKAGRSSGGFSDDNTFSNYLGRKIYLQRQQLGLVIPPAPQEKSTSAGGGDIHTVVQHLQQKHGSSRREKQKHRSSLEEAVACSFQKRHQQTSPKATIRSDLFFHGVICYMNACPNGEGLQRALYQHGGAVERYETSIITHVVAHQLSDAKRRHYQRACAVPVVVPAWIDACVQAGRRLPVANYLLMKSTMARNPMSHFCVKVKTKQGSLLNEEEARKETVKLDLNDSAFKKKEMCIRNSPTRLHKDVGGCNDGDSFGQFNSSDTGTKQKSSPMQTRNIHATVPFTRPLSIPEKYDTTIHISGNTNQEQCTTKGFESIAPSLMEQERQSRNGCEYTEKSPSNVQEQQPWSGLESAETTPSKIQILENEPCSSDNEDFEIDLPSLSQIQMSQVQNLPLRLREQILLKMDTEKTRRQAKKVPLKKEHRWFQTNVEQMFRLQAFKDDKEPLHGGETVSRAELEHLPMAIQLEIANGQDDTFGNGQFTPFLQTVNKRKRPYHRSEPMDKAPSWKSAAPRSPIKTKVEEQPKKCPTYTPLDASAFFTDNIRPLHAFLDENDPCGAHQQQLVEFLARLANEHRTRDAVVLLRSVRNRTDEWKRVWSDIFNAFNERVKNEHGFQLCASRV